MDSAIRRKTFDKAIDTILQKEDEDKCWSLYLSLMANPFVEHVNFDEFMERYSTPKNAEQVQVKTEPLNVEIEVDKANNLLKNFKPDKKKGGAKHGNRSI